jgi:hypothetical protein
MSFRDYNKLYVHTNRTDGSEKLLLGYQHDSREIVFKKDTETYFHVPYFTESIKLNESTLNFNGAVGGPFPAAADRIFKSRKNFGNVTAYGEPTDIADGTWFCSWLYQNENGTLTWMDRLYNPGKFNMSIASAQLTESSLYVPFNPVFRDVPSTMIFESGVMYKYFHIGEKSAAQLVTTLGGVSSERVMLDLKDWGNTTVDKSKNNAEVFVISNASTNELYPDLNDVERVPNPVISFDNNKNIEVLLDFEDFFNSTNEFTVSFWAKSPNWHSCQSTQLVGNMSSRGGYGLFVQNLSSFPFFVIPETGYGHLLYVNEGASGFLDKSVKLTPSPSVSATPELVAIDFDNNVIVANNDGSSTISKYDNAGRLIASTRLSVPRFSYLTNTEQPVQLICGPNDTFSVLTTNAIYNFDTYLNNTSTLVRGISSTTVAAYEYDTTTGEYDLLLHDGVNDVKYIQQTMWALSAFDGNLYRKESDEDPVMFAELQGRGTNLAIDPYDRIWVLHGTNDISVFNSYNEKLLDKPLLKLDIGEDKPQARKNISFFCAYDRSTNTKVWRCVVYYSNDLNFYVLDLEGNLLQTVGLISLFNSTILNVLKETSDSFKFFGKGDFTGYEHKRVFGKLAPYNQETQLVFRVALKDKTRNDLTFKQFKVQASIGNWDTESWQHIAIVLRNRSFKIYVNAVKNLELNYTGEYELSYELRPPFYIGTPVGSQSGFNNEIAYTSSIFNGYFEDIKMYDYALKPETLELFLRAALFGQDLYWSMPVPEIQYVEKIERMFKHKLPGAKSQFYSVKINGSKITDQATRAIIEEQIKQIVQQLQPANVDLLKVHWVD